MGSNLAVIMGDEAGGFHQALLIYISQGQIAALLGQLDADFPAYARCRSGNDGYPALQFFPYKTPLV